MANDPAGLGSADPRVREYLDRVLAPEDPVLKEIRERSAREGLPDIQVARFDGRHLEVLAGAIGARKIVEIGTLGGYSGVCLARALPAGGRLVTLEFEPKHAKVARGNIARAGLAGVVELRVAVGANYYTISFYEAVEAGL